MWHAAIWTLAVFGAVSLMLLFAAVVIIFERSNFFKVD